MFKVPVNAKTLATLKSQSEPQPVAGGQSEAQAWVLYDTATYVDATTTSLVFFTTTRANRRLSNLSPAGTLPEPQFFEIFYFAVDILLAPLADAPETLWVDAWNLLFGGTSGAPTLTFNLADKAWGPWPLSIFHGTGGVTGFGYSADTTALTESAYQSNSLPDGGLCIDGAITIPPQQSFNVTLDWSSALDLQADTEIRVSMVGVLHRLVL